MLVDWNEGYISVCPTPDLIPVEDKHTYIPTSTWGYIRGDVSEQKDLMNLLTTIESGLTAEQISLLVNADSRLNTVEQDIAALETSHELDITHINTEISKKANIVDVYTKSEIDSKGYLTEHQSLAGYATENWVYQRGYISAETDPIWSAEKHKYALKSELPSTAGFATTSWVNEQLTAKANTSDVYTKSEINGKLYATESWVKEQGYITEHQSLDNYYTKNEVDTAIENVEVDLTGYATQDWVGQQGYLTEHQSLANYYTKAEIDEAFNNIEVDVDLTGYATEDWVKNQDYITKYTERLINYYKKSEVDAAIENAAVDLTGYATEAWCAERYVTRHVEGLIYYYRKAQIDEMMAAKLDTNKIWTGTQAEWDAMTADQQNSYTIAMIEL